jgi:heme/copper-type cytochrome/quinol oxidase subunit 3
VTMRRAELGMAMFLIAEAVFFFLLILAFLYFRARANLNFQAGLLDTGLLLASSLSLWRAVAGSRLWLGVTIALGVAFLIGQGSQYLSLFRDGVTMSQGPFGTTFFTLTGAHGLHVLAGLVALAMVPVSAIRTVALYWYFFAAVWLAIFLVVYVWGAV